MADFKNGFTLGEVLITLVVIGIVAAMTIPNIFADINEKQIVTKLKKVYSTLNNATKAAVAMNGPVDYWEFQDASNVGANSLIFKKKLRLNITQDCGTSGRGCFKDSLVSALSGIHTIANYDTYGNGNCAKMILSDGVSVRMSLGSPDCSRNAASGSTDNVLNNACGSIIVDIDGPKGANTWGKDLFFFYITRNGEIVPSGVSGATETDHDIGHCRLSSYGYPCTAWVLYKGNMNYLKGETMEHW